MVTRKRFDPRSALPGSPFLTHITLREDRVQPGIHPLTVPWLVPSLDLRLSARVRFLVGENGTGKSTLLEAIAWSGGFFLRAETFFNFATYLEDVGSPFIAYGGKSLHQQSHGEAFLSLFQHPFEDGLYLLDEPEAALSPQRQLAFLRVLHDPTAQKIAQFVIATHSPMLLTFPGATIFSLDAGQIRPVTYQETDHFQITRNFLNGRNDTIGTSLMREAGLPLRGRAAGLGVR
jgi:predicted ATPase